MQPALNLHIFQGVYLLCSLVFWTLLSTSHGNHQYFMSQASFPHHLFEHSILRISKSMYGLHLAYISPKAHKNRNAIPTQQQDSL